MMDTQSNGQTSWSGELRRSAGKLVAGSFLFFLLKGLLWLVLLALPFFR